MKDSRNTIPFKDLNDPELVDLYKELGLGENRESTVYFDFPHQNMDDLSLL